MLATEGPRALAKAALWAFSLAALRKRRPPALSRLTRISKANAHVAKAPRKGSDTGSCQGCSLSYEQIGRQVFS